MGTRRLILPPSLRGITPRVTHLLARHSPPAAPRTEPARLTSTELEVLRWLSLGKRPGDIAAIMSTSIGYVHQVAHRVMNKLGANTSAGAVGKALRSGLID